MSTQLFADNPATTDMLDGICWQIFPDDDTYPSYCFDIEGANCISLHANIPA